MDINVHHPVEMLDLDAEIAEALRRNHCKVVRRVLTHDHGYVEFLMDDSGLDGPESVEKIEEALNKEGFEWPEEGHSFEKMNKMDPTWDEEEDEGEDKGEEEDEAEEGDEEDEPLTGEDFREMGEEDFREAVRERIEEFAEQKAGYFVSGFWSGLMGTETAASIIVDALQRLDNFLPEREEEIEEPDLEFGGVPDISDRETRSEMKESIREPLKQAMLKALRKQLDDYLAFGVALEEVASAMMPVAVGAFEGLKEEFDLDVVEA